MLKYSRYFLKLQSYILNFFFFLIQYANCMEVKREYIKMPFFLFFIIKILTFSQTLFSEDFEEKNRKYLCSTHDKFLGSGGAHHRHHFAYFNGRMLDQPQNVNAPVSLGFSKSMRGKSILHET